MNDILPNAEIKVEVLNNNCWENCKDFYPWIRDVYYAENDIVARRFECRNLDTCKRLSAFLERRGE